MRSPITRLLLTEWFQSKIWIIIAAGFGLAALLGPLLSSADLDPNMTAPARAQFLYGLGFILLFGYVPAVAAEMGSKQARHGFRLFYKSQGVSDNVHFACTVLSALATAGFIAATMLVSLAIFGSPSQPLTAKIQATILTLLSASVIIPLAVGLAQVAVPSIAFMATIAISVIGMYAPAGLEYIHQTASPQQQYIVEVAMTFLPDLRFGDQSLRITFGWPAIDAIPWLAACGYLIILTVISYAVGGKLFRLRKV